MSLNPKTALNDMSYEELEELLMSMSLKKYRVKQIFEWIHLKMIKSINEMTNISKALRASLNEQYYIKNVSILEKFQSAHDGTQKYLFQLYDGQLIESVLMKYKHGYALCISSQVGCRMGCEFCASTIDGLERNLSQGEMLQQVYEIQRENDIKISNIVIMGSGEPFDNFDVLIKFLRTINHESGQNISMRHITVSTCGLVDKIKAFADLQIPVTLAISLHAPTNELRKQTMPITNKYNIESIIDACRYYIKKTNRRVTFEYALIKALNDDDENALALSKLLKGLLCHVNLIPVNDVKEKNYVRSQEKRIERFQSILLSRGINATIRRELGSDINAACGQLRKGYKENHY